MTWNLIDSLSGSAILMLAVLLVRKPIASWFGARAAFALWLAPLVRLVAPQIPVDASMPDIFIQTQSLAAGAVEPMRAALPIYFMVALLWAGGAALFLCVHIGRYRRFLRATTSDARLIGCSKYGVPVFETAHVGGPAAAGLVRRRIFVPLGFNEAFDCDQQRLALTHEALHHRRGDLWSSAAALIVLAAHWFNPLAYAAHRAFRRDLEAACDAALLAGAPSTERQLYAGTILRCAARPIPHPICALTDSKELKGRLKMMKQEISFMRRMSGAALAVALSAGGLTIAMPASAQQPAPERERTEVRKVIIHDGKGDREISPELRAKMDKCLGQKVEVNSNTATTEKKQERTRILICAKPGESKDQMAASLERALGRIQSESDLSAQAKADLVAKMKAEIAELRAGK